MPEMDDMVINTEELLDGERELDDLDEKLWRQVHPTQVFKQELQEVVGPDAFHEIIDPGAFVGTSAAKYEVSTSMASIVTAEDAFDHYTKSLNLKSAGTYTVTVEVVVGTMARVIDDSQLQTGQNAVTGHAYIDLRGMPRSMQKRARSTMADFATKARKVHPKD